ncbi:MAG: hypothetical protein K2R98_28320 [Gemmataceae bacterium]|nr:hypothetical protein [Gemmataceae bacterium]
MHRIAASRRKRQDKEMVGTYSRIAGVPKAVGRRRVSLVVTLSRRQKRGDDDNWWKSLLDALVAAGQLVDDSPDWLERGSVAFQRGDPPATRIILEDLPNVRADPTGKRSVG